MRSSILFLNHLFLNKSVKTRKTSLWNWCFPWCGACSTAFLFFFPSSLCTWKFLCCIYKQTVFTVNYEDWFCLVAGTDNVWGTKNMITKENNIKPFIKKWIQSEKVITVICGPNKNKGSRLGAWRALTYTGRWAPRCPWSCHFGTSQYM